MRRIFVFVIVLIMAVLGWRLINALSAQKLKKRVPVVTKKPVEKKLPPLRVGEKITYDVRMNSFVLGKAVFNQLNRTVLKGETVDVATFKTDVKGFYDIEKIYSDPISHLPFMVERDIQTLTSKERIIEDYDQKEFTLTLTKLKGKNKEETFIKKKGPIHNAILLPFYVRDIPKLYVGWTLKVELPTRVFEIKLVSIEDLKVSIGKFQCYRFESVPKRFEIWITTDKRRIPIKITGSAVIGYNLVIRDYSY